MGRHRHGLPHARLPYGELSRRRDVRLAAALLGLALVAPLGGGAHVAGRPLPPPLARSAPLPRDDTADTLAQQRGFAVRDLLVARATAVRRHDRAAFLRTVDPAPTPFRTRQAALFDALRPLSFASWSYDLDATEDHAVDLPARRDYGGAPVWAPNVTLRYRIAGFDPVPTAVAQFLTFVHRARGWYLASDDDFAPDYQTRREVWDFGAVDVVRGARSIVIGHPDRHQFMVTMARQADAAVPAVSGVWGTGWSQRVVVIVPKDAAELNKLLGEAGDLSQIAAVAVAELPQAMQGYRPVGNRVLLNTSNFLKLSRLGRQVVLNHEVTHVATRDVSGGVVPTWLVEGMADYVAYRNTGIRVRSIARELAADLRSGRVPKALPQDDAFRGGNPKLAQVYEMAWLATRMIADRIGVRGLLAFYRELGSARSGDSDALSRTLRRMLHMTLPTFVQTWRTYLIQQVG